MIRQQQHQEQSNGGTKEGKLQSTGQCPPHFSVLLAFSCGGPSDQPGSVSVPCEVIAQVDTQIPEAARPLPIRYLDQLIATSIDRLQMFRAVTHHDLLIMERLRTVWSWYLSW